MITGPLQGTQRPYSQHSRSTGFQRTCYIYMVRKAFCPDLPMLEEHEQQNITCFASMPHRNTLLSTTLPVTFIKQDIYISIAKDEYHKFLASTNLPTWNYLCWKDTNHRMQPIASQRLQPTFL